MGLRIRLGGLGEVMDCPGLLKGPGGISFGQLLDGTGNSRHKLLVAHHSLSRIAHRRS